LLPLGSGSNNAVNGASNNGVLITTFKENVKAP
jgi:hypothetical protein